MVKSEELDGKIEIGFNLSDGEPLTEKIKTQRKFINDNGHVYKSVKGFTLNCEEKVAAYEKFKAQLERCINHGIIPIHIDSHDHVHHFWGIGRVFVGIANQNQIPVIRL